MKVAYAFFGKNLLSLPILLLLTLSVLSTLNMDIARVSASIPDSPYIAVVPPTIVDETLTPGKNFTVSIYTDYTGDDVWGWQFTLTYNPTIIQGVNVTNGDLIHPDKSVYAIFEPGEFDNVAGKLSLTLAYFYYQPPYVPPTTTSGPGTLANVTFTVVGTGGSNITLGMSPPGQTQLKAVDHNIIDAVLNPNQIGHGLFSNVPLPPVADANGPYSGSEGTPIMFDATGSIDLDGTIDLYEWDWDNNGTYDESTASPTINHTWPDDRTGTVGLRVTDDDGQTHTDTASVTVNNVAPTANAGPDRAVYVNQIVNFSGSFTDPGSDSYTIFWDFGDGSNASGTLTPTHNYTEADVRTVTLNVTDDDAGVGTDTLTITVSTVPVHDVAILSATPNATKVIQGSAVKITVVAYNKGTETESFNITAYANTTEVGTQGVTNLGAGDEITRSFIWETTGVSLGNYIISANASVVPGETDTADNTRIDGEVNVNTPPTAPVVDIIPNAPVTSDNLTCTVTSPSSDPDSDTITYTYEWYRDRGTGFEPQPSLTTVTTAELSVTIDSSNTQKGDVWRCTVTPNDGTEKGPSGQDEVTIVNSPPTANANGPYVSDEGSPITFGASGSSDPDEDALQYRWDFNNDGAWDTEYSTDPTASYTWGDDYSGTILVDVYDGGLTDTDTATVTVNNVAPTVDAGLDRAVYVNQIVNFSGSFTDPGWLDSYTIFWDFGDGSNASGTLTPTHVYPEANLYTVTFNVTDDDGEFGTDVLNVTVSPVIFSVTVDGLEFNVAIESNSTVSGFHYSKDQNEISFSVASPDGTVGFCNVTIPMGLMKGESSWLILVDGVEVTDYIQSDNGTHTFLHFTYMHTTHNIKISVRLPPPPFPWVVSIAVVVVAIVAAAGVAVYILKIRKRARAQTTFKNGSEPIKHLRRWINR